MQRTVFILFLYQILILGLFSQQNEFRKFYGPFLEQDPPGPTPELFAPGIIPTEGFEFGGAFPPDGKVFYFTRRSTYNGSGNRIYFKQFINNRWTDPEIAPFAIIEDLIPKEFRYAQIIGSDKTNSHILSEKELDSLLQKPICLLSYRPNQLGYLSKTDSLGNEEIDTTFSVEQIEIPSDGILINGWLYMPLGKSKCPLIVLTSGGGNGPNIRSFSDWIAPILAHCGIAAFVHDKRGTGESEGVFKETIYDDYISDAGNCALYLSNHNRIDKGKIGILGGSEGGRIAVLAASRYPEIEFAISFTGTVVSTIEDRIYAQKGWLNSLNLPDTDFHEVVELHEQSIRAWASENRDKHKEADLAIMDMRKEYDEDILPYTKQEMDSLPELIPILPTWYSLTSDYLTELEHFNKKWLAIFGEQDQRVPTQQSVNNINQYMAISGNNDYWIAVIPDCGHAPINLKTNRLVRLDNLIINWLKNTVMNN